MNNVVPNQVAVTSRSGNIGFSALTTILIAAMPKCPICRVALMGALGAGSIIISSWLQPVAVALLLLSHRITGARSSPPWLSPVRRGSGRCHHHLLVQVQT